MLIFHSFLYVYQRADVFWMFLDVSRILLGKKRAPPGGSNRRPLRAGLPADLQPVLKKIEDSGGAGGSMYFAKSAGSCWFWAIPSGKQSQKKLWKITMLLVGKSTISMAIVNSYVSHYQRVPTLI